VLNVIHNLPEIYEYIVFAIKSVKWRYWTGFVDDKCLWLLWAKPK